MIRLSSQRLLSPVTHVADQHGAAYPTSFPPRVNPKAAGKVAFAHEEPDRRQWRKPCEALAYPNIPRSRSPVPGRFSKRRSSP